jgi:glycogen phosphorylase
MTSSGTSRTEVRVALLPSPAFHRLTLLHFHAVTPRRWLDQCNPGLSKLITDTLKIPKGVWLKDLTKLAGLLEHTEDATFRKKWAAVKQSNKERLANYVQQTLGYKINTSALFDVQIKRLHEYKRQTLNILGVIHVCWEQFSELSVED